MADEWTTSHGTIGTALPIESPRGVLRGWFVPVTYSDRLLGYFQFASDLTPIRYSSFQRRSGDLNSCPLSSLWIDSQTVKAKAIKTLRPGETAEEAYLSYDAIPSRLAWAVPLVSASGRRIVYVAGDTVFEGRGEVESTGG